MGLQLTEMGVEVFIHHHYNLFSDYCTIIIIIFTYFVCIIFKKIYLVIYSKLKFWDIK